MEIQRYSELKFQSRLVLAAVSAYISGWAAFLIEPIAAEWIGGRDNDPHHLWIAGSFFVPVLWVLVLPFYWFLFKAASRIWNQVSGGESQSSLLFPLTGAIAALLPSLLAADVITSIDPPPTPYSLLLSYSFFGTVGVVFGIGWWLVVRERLRSN